LLPLLNLIATHSGLQTCGYLCGSALLQLNKSRVPQRVHVFFPAVESHLNTVATTILSEPGMKRLMDVADEMNDEPECNTLLIPRCIRRLEYLHVPGNCFDDAVAQFAITLLIVCVRVFGKVDDWYGSISGIWLPALSGHVDASDNVVPCGRSYLMRLRAVSLRWVSGYGGKDLMTCTYCRELRPQETLSSTPETTIQ
jgi:hypothetical protein